MIINNTNKKKKPPQERGKSEEGNLPIHSENGKRFEMINMLSINLTECPKLEN